MARKVAAKAGGEARTIGRKPTVKFSMKLIKEICDRLAQGETWSAMACTEGMPSQAVLYQWRAKKPGVAEALAAAREHAADAAADELLALARETTAANASANRVKIGALQWQAAKAAPHRYGARAEAADSALMRVEVRVRRFQKITREDGTMFLREIMTEDGQ